MQEPIRYYITKRGEEPTVRSVKVAQSGPEAEDRVTLKEDVDTEPKASKRPVPSPARAVERLVKDAIRGRSAQR